MSYPQRDYFIVSQHIGVARHVICSKPGAKPAELFVRLMTYSLTKSATQH